MNTATLAQPIRKDTRWLIAWGVIVAIIAIWDSMFLNGPALKRVATGALNTLLIALLVTAFTAGAAWVLTQVLESLSSRERRGLYMAVMFVLNIIRTVPQILAVLFCYIGISLMVERGGMGNSFVIFLCMAGCMALSMANEMIDLMRERIDHFKHSDFYNAMRVCGISERRIINRDILWQNSRIHIFNKLISIFGMAVFLQCSVDFVISVGLSTNVNAVNLPVTLGSVLANIESKQDILAIGYVLTHPLYTGRLFFEHLQGISTAFLIVSSLLCIHQIANGFAERHRI